MEVSPPTARCSTERTMQSERVRHIMTQTAVSIGIDEPITEALRLFARHPVHQLPVVDALVLKGILSSADILKLEYFLPKPGTPPASLLNERFRIDAMMRTDVVTANPEDTIVEAAARMIVHGMHALPVVSDTNRLLGTVTTTAIMRALLHGMGIQSTPGRIDSSVIPTELEMRRAVESAISAVQTGTDTNGVSTCLLSLHRRNALLEKLLADVARYLHSGHDEQMHALLMRDVDQLRGRTVPDTRDTFHSERSHRCGQE
jgi:CBS domain-containing protein